MKRIRIPPTIAIVALLAALGGIALAAQDRYSVQVPGGLAFSEFRGYQDWQVIAASHNGDKMAIIFGNPAMIEAYKSGIPRTASLSPTAPDGEDPLDGEEGRGSARRAGRAGRLA